MSESKRYEVKRHDPYPNSYACANDSNFLYYVTDRNQPFVWANKLIGYHYICACDTKKEAQLICKLLNEKEERDNG